LTALSVLFFSSAAWTEILGQVFFSPVCGGGQRVLKAKLACPEFQDPFIIYL